MPRWAPNEVRDFCKTDAAGEELLKAAMQQLHLSARAFHRVLKLAKTIMIFCATTCYTILLRNEVPV